MYVERCGSWNKFERVETYGFVTPTLTVVASCILVLTRSIGCTTEVAAMPEKQVARSEVGDRSEDENRRGHAHCVFE